MTRFHIWTAVFVSTALLSWTVAQGQDFPTYIKSNSISLVKPDSLNSSVYKLLDTFQVIMVGEMHGTNEPAKFVIGLAKLFASKGDSVQVGLEIPAGQMTKFLNEHSDSSIYSSEFFRKVATDGREGYAWAEVISSLNKLKNIKLFFFDTDKTNFVSLNKRDSIMYLNIKKQIQNHSKYKTITLSGNVHNMLVPFRTNPTMTTYLLADSELKLSGKICSINHRYKGGTMFNNAGKGLELRNVSSPDSDYSTSVDYNCYFLLLQPEQTDRHNAIFFTRSVTATKMVTEK